MKYTMDQIDAEAVNHLHGGCTQLETAKVYMALHAHSAVESISMINDDGIEVVIVDMIINGQQYRAEIKEQNDVELWIVIDDAGRDYEHQAFGVMTRAGLFSMLSDVVNVQAYITNAPVYSLMGIELFSHFKTP
ncbi:hypothetical protein ABXZ88_003910 [Vibrio fluvialis]